MPNKRDDQTMVGLTFMNNDPILALLGELAEQYQGLNVSRTTAARIFLKERVELYHSGWKMNDPVMKDLLNQIVRDPNVVEICQTLLQLDEEDLEHTITTLRNTRRKRRHKDVITHRGA